MNSTLLLVSSKSENKNTMRFVAFLFLFCFCSSYLFGKNPYEYESHSNIMFKNKELLHIEKSVSLEVDFNNAVLALERGEYQKAIALFKKTAKILKVPSFLNIGISYYKLNSTNNAFLYLKKIYDFKDAAKEDVYSYVSASYYLYLITKDRKYISTILQAVKTAPKNKVTENVKRLMIDTYIVLKNYDLALELALKMKEKENLKIAILYLQKREYEKANIYLDAAFKDFGDKETLDTILWLKVFSDLKINNLAKIKENIVMMQKKTHNFHANKKLPIKIFFNPKKYDSKEYLSRITAFSDDRTIDMIFYFAPFIFVDNKEIYNDATLGYVLKNQSNIDSLDMMIGYNKQFVSIAKDDPIIKTMKLQQMVDAKESVKSYEYYNLGLSYAHNFDFLNAHKYFKRAYDLSKSNKLYASMALISAKRGDITLKKEELEKLKNNLLSNNGTYKYLGKYVYKLVFDLKYPLDGKGVSIYDRKSIFLRALSFLESMKKNKKMLLSEPLLQADVKDPMVYLFRSLAFRENENNYKYMARLQDTLPKSYNDYFLKGPPLITQYYIETVKSLGIFKKIDFNIKNERTPSYLRTKAIVQLFDGFPRGTLRIMEGLQKEYKLNDIYTLDLLAAAHLSMGDESNALATLSELQFEFNDSNAKFLSGIDLIQSLRLTSASQFFTQKYDGFFIDFKINNLDAFLEGL